MPNPLPEARTSPAEEATVAIPGRGAAAEYAAHLLRSLGVPAARVDCP